MTRLTLSAMGRAILVILTDHPDPAWIVARGSDYIALIIPTKSGKLMRSFSLGRRHVYELAEAGLITIGPPQPITYQHRQPSEAREGRPIALTDAGRRAIHPKDDA